MQPPQLVDLPARLQLRSPAVLIVGIGITVIGTALVGAGLPLAFSADGDDDIPLPLALNMVGGLHLLTGIPLIFTTYPTPEFTVLPDQAPEGRGHRTWSPLDPTRLRF